MAIIICISENYYQAWKPVTERAGGLFWALVTSMPVFFVETEGGETTGQKRYGLPIRSYGRGSPKHNTTSL